MKIPKIIIYTLSSLFFFTACPARATTQQTKPLKYNVAKPLNYDLKVLKTTKNLIPIVVIGAGPGGLSSAFYGAREGYHTVDFEAAQPGGQLKDTHYVENWPAITKELGADLIKRLEKQAKDAGAITVPQSIIDADLSQWPFPLTMEDGTKVHAMAVIIASGAMPRKLGIEGEEKYWGKGVASCTLCDAPFTKGQDVLIVGGGDSSIEFARNLAPFARSITLLVRSDELDASARMQKKLAAHPTIKIIYNTSLTKILGDGKRIQAVETINNVTKKKQPIKTQWVFLSIGQTPNTTFLKNQLPCDESGCIILPGKSQETNIKGVFVAGRVSNTKYKTGIMASGDGLRAALDALAFFEEIGFEEQQEHALEKQFYHYVDTTKKSDSHTQIHEVTSDEDAQKRIKASERLTLLQFYSPSCPHCRAMEPIVAQVADQLGQQVDFMRADINKLSALSRSYKIQGIPTFILINKGKEIARTSGEMSQKKLAEFISSTITR